MNNGRKSSLPAGAALAEPFHPSGTAPRASTHQSVRSSGRSFTSSGDVDIRAFADGTDFISGGQPSWTMGSQQYPPPNEDTTPYLVGHRPNVHGPDIVHAHEFIYGRELTEDELRARHLYWGNAPQHLLKGLPKFNGKDFYPPSPKKGQSSEESWVSVGSASRLEPQQDHAIPQGVSEHVADTDPFQSLGQSGPILSRNGPGVSTQSEALAAPETLDEEVGGVKTMHTGHGTTRVGRSFTGLNNSSFESSQTSSAPKNDKPAPSDAEEGQELLFTGRRSVSRAMYV
jgi:hypothetical protein